MIFDLGINSFQEKVLSVGPRSGIWGMGSEMNYGIDHDSYIDETAIGLYCLIW